MLKSGLSQGGKEGGALSEADVADPPSAKAGKALVSYSRKTEPPHRKADERRHGILLATWVAETPNAGRQGCAYKPTFQAIGGEFALRDAWQCLQTSLVTMAWVGGGVGGQGCCFTLCSPTT